MSFWVPKSGQKAILIFYHCSADPIDCKCDVSERGRRIGRYDGGGPLSKVLLSESTQRGIIYDQNDLENHFIKSESLFDHYLEPKRHFSKNSRFFEKIVIFRKNRDFLKKSRFFDFKKM